MFLFLPPPLGVLRLLHVVTNYPWDSFSVAFCFSQFAIALRPPSLLYVEQGYSQDYSATIYVEME